MFYFCIFTLWTKNWYFGSFKSLAYKSILSISATCSYIKLSHAFAFPDPKLPIINILYGWSGIYEHFLLWSSLFSFAISSKLKISVCYLNEIYAV